ncbi:MAG: selenocysteine-specific translation elongation factor [Planctomycetales bacterium]|nr:selenocysteine-specific translation elongation factor [Planctomycetales bacterium]
MKDLILGTAGHIDHGKTSLIRALTGTNTDRLPEEQKRGITIELGFAELEVDDYRLGIVDVPGHEKFVRQMLAGATGMDLALLVVAADDSVKTQTREHFEVLRILDLPAGVIALTKCDVADPDWISLVEEEIRELVAGSFLEHAPIVRTSSTKQTGIEDLRAALKVAAESVVQQRSERLEGPFRMAIDRAFTIEGHGTVVTGSVSYGRCNVGDRLLIEPGHLEVRVRGLQNHDRVAESIQRGQRAAINLAGIQRDDVTRGHELISPGHLLASRLVSVQIQMLDDVQRPLKNRSKVRLHIGTTEVLATVSILDADKAEPGQSVYAQLFLSEEIVASWNQPFVLRSESPVDTIAGGRILVPVAEKIKRSSETQLGYLRQLQSADELERSSAAIYFAGAKHVGHEELSRTAGVADPRSVYDKLCEHGDVVRVAKTAQREVWMHQAVCEEIQERIGNSLTRLHDDNPLRTMFDRATIVNQFSYLEMPAIVDALLRRMEIAKTVRLTEKGVGLADRGPKLSKNEKVLLASLIQQFKDAAFQPPTVKECQAAAPKNQASVPQLISLAASDGDLVEISSDFFIHADVERELKEKLIEAMPDGNGLTLSEIREMLQTTRKYAVPICEYLDRTGFTVRDGDLRRIKKT